ncbi:MAG: type II toxin-antitoxin system RelE/ParE family toxin [Ferruginibacter sp.]
MKSDVVETILWTDSAKLTFDKIIEWLRLEWSEKEVNNFIDRTEEMLTVLKRYPEMCRPSMKRKKCTHRNTG